MLVTAIIPLTSLVKQLEAATMLSATVETTVSLSERLERTPLYCDRP